MEAHVADQSRAIAATVAGAILGGVAGYLFFTEHGRSLRRQLEPALDDIAQELSSFRDTVEKAANVASRGWRLINEAMGDTLESGGRYPTTHQTSPF